MQEARMKLNAGDLKGAIESVIQIVKQKPTDFQARTFLFELSLFAGDWDRAEKQLDAIGQIDPQAALGAKIYQNCIVAERKRSRYFNENAKPEFVTEVPEYVYGLLRANDCLINGDTLKARELMDEVEQNRPAFSCKVNDLEVTDFRDCNDLTSCVMEVFIYDAYVWIPFEEIISIEFAPLQSLRDIFWRHASVKTRNGTGGEVFLPAFYADSWKSDDDQIKLGKVTDWREIGNDIYVGEGQKLFSINDKIEPILEISQISFQSKERA